MSKRILFFFICASFFSCNDNVIFDSYVAVENAKWRKEEAKKFNFTISDTINKHNLFIQIRNNQDFGYQNLFLITKLSFPNGKKIVDTLEYAMADAKGKFLGSGLSSAIENKLFYKENKVFTNSGKYHLSVLHAMRKQGEVNGIKELEGILDVGFRIEKAN